MSFLKQQVNSFSNFASFFTVITQNSSVNFKLIHFLLWIQGSHQSPNFETFKYSGKNLPNSSCHFLNHRTVFLQILHHSSVSWDINPLYFFSWNFIHFQRKEPMKVQIWWNFTWAVKSMKFCTLTGSFCPNHIKFQLKKVQRSYLSWHWRVMQSLKKNWLVVSNMTQGICWIFTEPLRSLKISFRLALFVQSIQGLSYKNTEKLSFMTLNSDAKFKWGIGWTFIRALKSLKSCTLMGSFCPKHIIFGLENLIGIMCHDTEGSCKI